MKRNSAAFAILVGLPLALAGLGLLALPACQGETDGAAETKGEALVELWRLDCGAFHVGTLNVFSDTQAYPGRKMELTDSCYLIRHGDETMLWDTGLPVEALGEELDRSSDDMEGTLSVTLAAQLAEIGLTSDQVGRVGISHYHFDHVGQLPVFSGSALLIGKGDWEVVTGDDPPEFLVPAFAPWTSGGGNVEPVEGDYDVFGDGSVVMLSTPGHTPGHYSLLVRLADMGPVLLTGDLAHFRENYETNGVPPFNSDREDTIASLERFKQLAADNRATVIIQHEPGDIDKLPAFPTSAR
ncbi:MAG: N-acyl homoserine lactonase family protein [Thermoanaerobaculia bacterium]